MAAAKLIPPPQRDLAEIEHLLTVLETLLGPEGCAWDRKQTVQTLFPYLIEEIWEAYEHIKASEAHKVQQEEWGDVFYTLMFLIKTAARDRHFDRAIVFRSTAEKMRRRHPHVFADASPPDPAEAYQRWQEIKMAEGKPADKSSKRYRGTLMKVFQFLAEHPENREKMEAFLAKKAA